MIALKSGTVSIDRHIMEGYVPSNFNKNLSNQTDDYLNRVDNICKLTQNKKFTKMEN